MNKMRGSERRLWRQAKTLADVGELTAQWLEGKISSQPGYAPGCGPDEETLPYVRTLAKACRAGYVTYGSQPGDDGPGYDGARWRQRAAVEGFADDAAYKWLRAAAERRGLLVIAHEGAGRFMGRKDSLTVTESLGRAHTRFGTRLSRTHIRDGWTGYGVCSRNAVEALCTAWQVTIIDRDWNRNDRLWPILDQFAAERKAVA